MLHAIIISKFTELTENYTKYFSKILMKSFIYIQGTYLFIRYYNAWLDINIAYE